MLFSSIPFLYYFLPAVLLLYFLSPKKLRNRTLFLSSLVFYAWGEPIYVFLMLGTIACGYFFALGIERRRGSAIARVLLFLSVAASLSSLLYFKYADFFISNINVATGLSIPLLNIALPIGISFYTFQILSYTVDVYRGDVPAQRNLIDLGAYITMFPQLIAGPIVRYIDVERSLRERASTSEDLSYGARRLILGLSKKILIANQLGELVKIFYASQDKSVAFFWMYAIAFTLHVYFDFSGYSDMAIGLGRIFGFKFMENFNYPFISKSISEFWRRWHISLGSWFRDYVYIPLGGNRVRKGRFVFNILVVWCLTGFWHGAEWTFAVWGLYFAVLLLAEKLFLGRYIEKSRAIAHIYVSLFVLISFVIFDAKTLPDAAAYIGAMFGSGEYPLANAEFFYYLRSYSLLFAVAIIGATPATKLFIEKTRFGQRLSFLEAPVLFILFILITAYLVDGSFNPFLYFSF